MAASLLFDAEEGRGGLDLTTLLEAAAQEEEEGLQDIVRKYAAERYEEGYEAYVRLLKKRPDSPYVPDALVNLGGLASAWRLADPKLKLGWSRVQIGPLDARGLDELLNLLPEAAQLSFQLHRDFITRQIAGRPNAAQALCARLHEDCARGDDGEFFEDGAAFDASWRVAPVQKRAGNPFPDRISVGRAQNCDIVLRLSYISKLHAHFLVGPRGLMYLCDQRSSNGTHVNNQPLRPGTRVKVDVGDAIGFGQLVAELVSGEQFYERLRARPRASGWSWRR